MGCYGEYLIDISEQCKIQEAKMLEQTSKEWWGQWNDRNDVIGMSLGCFRWSVLTGAKGSPGRSGCWVGSHGGADSNASDGPPGDSGSLEHRF